MMPVMKNMYKKYKKEEKRKQNKELELSIGLVALLCMVLIPFLLDLCQRDLFSLSKHRVGMCIWFSERCLLNSLDYTFCLLHTCYHMSLFVRKPVFGVSDQTPHKPGCTATKDG